MTRGGSVRTTTYAFVLDHRITASAVAGNEYLLLCHLLGINPADATDPRAGGAGPA